MAGAEFHFDSYEATSALVVRYTMSEEPNARFIKRRKIKRMIMIKKMIRSTSKSRSRKHGESTTRSELPSFSYSYSCS